MCIVFCFSKYHRVPIGEIPRDFTGGRREEFPHFLSHVFRFVPGRKAQIWTRKCRHVQVWELYKLYCDVNNVLQEGICSEKKKFHIFYLMFSGLSPDEKHKYGLESADTYRYSRMI